MYSTYADQRERGKQQIQEVLERLKNRTLVDTRAVYEVPLDPCPNCKYCGGVGFVMVQTNSIYHPMFGKTIQCPNTPKKNRDNIPSKDDGLTPYERTLKWDNVKDIGENVTSHAIEAIKTTLQRGYGMIYLHGSYGVAKSVLLKIATARAQVGGKHACYARMMDILDDYRDGWDIETMRKYQRIPVLCIDELETYQQTEWSENQFFSLLDERYRYSIENMASITITAANVPPSEMPPKIQNRLTDGRVDVIHMPGQSLRPHMSWS